MGGWVGTAATLVVAGPGWASAVAPVQRGDGALGVENRAGAGTAGEVVSAGAGTRDTGGRR